MNTYKIPFNRPTLVGTEFNRIQDAINGGQISGDGPYTKKCEALLDKELGVPRVLLTTSCTHALEMAALLLELAPGDEVILPSWRSSGMPNSATCKKNDSVAKYRKSMAFLTPELLLTRWLFSLPPRCCLSEHS